MTYFCQVTFLIFISTYLLINSLKLTTEERVTHIRHSQDKYNKRVLRKWEFELDGKIEYPRGDKNKLNQISALWTNYYACCLWLAHSVSAAGTLKSVATAVYEDGIARLPCGLCVAPDTSAGRWLYQKQQSPFTILTIDERMIVSDDGHLTIFKVRRDDAGGYKCTIGLSAGSTVLLDVVDRTEPYNVVKPITSEGPYPAADQIIRFKQLSLLLFTSWSPWSECSVCARVGRRRRYGMCYVTVKNDKTLAPSAELDFTTTNTLKLFNEFPDGIPCRSRHLPLRVRNLPAVAQRRNEIMIGLCKVACETASVFEVRSTNGALLEQANNTAGVYSLSQRLPPGPPPPVSETIFATRGQKLVLVCPGTSLRDVPLSWRVGTRSLAPREAHATSGGRVHLNARDNVVFEDATYADANLYSCWQRQSLVGTVKLCVWDACPWRRRATLLATLLGAAITLRALDALLRQRRRRAIA